jgi:hypothetical protein
MQLRFSFGASRMSISTVRNPVATDPRLFGPPLLPPTGPGTGAPTTVPAKAPAPAPSPSTEAQQVLDTGRRPFIADNYEARMEAFAQALQKGDASYRSQLMNEILNRDPNALNSWMRSDRADTLQKQGHITADQRTLIAQAMTDPQVDAHKIKGLLSSQGLFGVSRNDNVRSIVSILTSGDSAHMNGVLADLSDSDLKSLATNIEHGDELLGGQQGISGSQRNSFFQMLASRADPTQYARVVDAFAQKDGYQSSIDVASLVSDAAKTMSPSELAKFVASATPSLAPWARSETFQTLYQPGNIGKLGAIEADRLSQFKGADGKPLWKSEQQKDALAAMLLQDPSLTPQKFIHDQNMAQLAIAAYSGDHPLPPGFVKVDPSTDPALKGKLSPADFTNNQTSFNASLFKDTKTGTYVLAFRGSDSNKDWTDANIPQGIGWDSPQYDQAIRLSTTLKGLLGNKLTDITGHSLGGGLAATAGMMTHTQTTTFDAAGVNPKTIARAHGTWDASMTTNYHVEGDVLTNLEQESDLPVDIPDPVGKEISIAAFDPNGQLLNFATAGVSPEQLHSQNYVSRGMLAG